jgi:hypothetical protein
LVIAKEKRMISRRLTQRTATVIAVTGSSAALMLGTTATAAEAATVHGCPSGYVCLYPQNAGWNYDRPSHKWYTYGAHKLSYQYGNHNIYNNQTDDALAWFCTNYAGTTCPSYLSAGTWAVANFTPINSVNLVPAETLPCFRVAMRDCLAKAEAADRG